MTELIPQGYFKDASFKKGAVIFRQNEHAVHVYVITTGFVKIVHETPLGSQILLEIFAPGDSVGDLASVLEKNPYSAIALTPVHLKKMDRAEYIAIQKKDTQYAIRALGMISGEAETFLQYLSLEHEASVENRLMTFFAKIGGQHGYLEKDVVKIPFLLERKDLAMAVNCRTETLIRLIRKWEKAGLFKTEKDGFSIYHTKASSGTHRSGWICDQCALYRKSKKCVGQKNSCGERQTPRSV